MSPSLNLRLSLISIAGDNRITIINYNYQHALNFGDWEIYDCTISLKLKRLAANCGIITMLKVQIVSLVHISDKLVWNNKKQTSVISQLFNRLKNPSEGIKTLKIASMLAEFRLAAWRGLNVWLLVNNKFCLSSRGRVLPRKTR